MATRSGASPCSDSLAGAIPGWTCASWTAKLSRSIDLSSPSLEHACALGDESLRQYRLPGTPDARAGSVLNGLALGTLLAVGLAYAGGRFDSAPGKRCADWRRSSHCYSATERWRSYGLPRSSATWCQCFRWSSDWGPGFLLEYSRCRSVSCLVGYALPPLCSFSLWTWAVIPSHTYYYDGGVVTDNFGAAG